jgi:acyl-CoA reductase-like NAD-dependent aldehyde dehydrogenase
LVQLRGLGAVAFTGSRATGRRVAYAAAAGVGAASDDTHPLPPRMIMELGGKDAVYVRADVADPAAAATSVSNGVASIANGAFYNAGQGCCAVERVYVHRDVAEPFTAAFLAAAEAFHRGMGDPLDPATTLGPLAQAAAPQRVARQVAAAVEAGAEILYRGDGVPTTGYFVAPTVVGGAALRGAQGAHALTRDETFGPVVALVVVDDDAEAVEAMADTSYGLTAGVYTADEEAALRILRGLDVGTGYWNACNHVSPRLPSSGRMGSGAGGTLGLEGLRSFVKTKSMYLRSSV